MTVKAKGAVYVTSRQTGGKFVIRILDEDACLVEVHATVEPIIVGEARIAGALRPTREVESKQ